MSDASVITGQFLFGNIKFNVRFPLTSSLHLLKAITVRIHIWTLISVSRIVYVLYSDYINHHLLVYLTVKTIGNTWQEVKNKSNTTKNIRVKFRIMPLQPYCMIFFQGEILTKLISWLKHIDHLGKAKLFNSYVCIYVY